MNHYATLDEVYGPCYNKKSKKSKKKTQSVPICDAYARQYSNAMKMNRSNKSDSQFFTLPDDHINNYASYNPNDVDTRLPQLSTNYPSQSQTNNSRGNLQNIQGIGYYDQGGSEMEIDTNEQFNNNNRNMIGDAENEIDYFDKLYKGHDFKNMESGNGLNIMYNKNASQNYDNNERMKNDMIYYDNDIDIESDPSPIIPATQLPTKHNETILEYQRDKYYMDFGLYLISGILLIFILEQFVQIGMSIRQNRIEKYNSHMNVSTHSVYTDEPALSL